MTLVEFYLLPCKTIDQRLTLVCRLADKALQKQQTLYIHTQDQAMTEQLDQMLWEFRPESFVAHSIATNNTMSNDLEPILLSHDIEPDAKRDVFINLSDDEPVFFSRFPRALEIVDEAPETKKHGRQRWSFYKVRGYPMKHHHVPVSAL
jgi:DNA polymerase-3 subunit chi